MSGRCIGPPKMGGAGYHPIARACAGVCVCVCAQGDWSRFAYPVQRSYGILVDDWSDQPLVPATLKLLPTL